VRRDPLVLGRERFDLLVVGGGITGACVAWDAALRGLSVALVERGDFGHATSAASSKIIHGGLRYLQQGLLHRVRESAAEQAAFLRIAPHLVHPIPFLVPTYGHGLQGKELLAAGMLLYELLSRDCRGMPDPAKRLPRFRVLGRREVLELVPELSPEGLTGGVVYHDAQVYSPERATLALVAGAVEHGARVANYVEAVRASVRGGRIEAVLARDRLSGGEFEIRARIVVNAAGPWIFRLGHEEAQRARLAFAKGIHLVTRRLHPTHALALATRLPNEAIVNRGGRHIFFIPWRGRTLVGTTNVAFRAEPDALTVTEEDIGEFLAEIRRAWPGSGLRREDVRFGYGGLYVHFDGRLREGVYKPSSAWRIFDHARLGGPEGLLTVLGARFTTARRLAEACVDVVFRKLGRTPPPCPTTTTPVPGGDIESFADFFDRGLEVFGREIGSRAAAEGLKSYGTRFERVVELARQRPALGATLSPDPPVLAAAVVYAVREEMAVRLADVVFRRTGLGTVGNPGEEPLRACARLMAAELGWDEQRLEAEIADTARAFEPFGRGTPDA
jgi:glycerol-3-phosphate dehydrogenase